MSCANFTHTARATHAAVVFGQLRATASTWDSIRKSLEPLAPDVVSALWISEPRRCACFVSVLRPVAALWLPLVSLPDLRTRWGVRQNMEPPLDTAIFMHHTLHFGLELLFSMRHAHATVLALRTDVTYRRSLPTPLPYAERADVIVVGSRGRFVWGDENTDSSTVCSPNLPDIFFYGTAAAMAVVANTAPELDRILVDMRRQPEYRAIFKHNMSHNWRRPGMFVGNNEAVLGHHLRMHGMACRTHDVGPTVVASQESRWHHRGQLVFDANDTRCRTKGVGEDGA